MICVLFFHCVTLYTASSGDEKSGELGLTYIRTLEAHSDRARRRVDARRRVQSN